MVDLVSTRSLAITYTSQVSGASPCTINGISCPFFLPKRLVFITGDYSHYEQGGVDLYPKLSGSYNNSLILHLSFKNVILQIFLLRIVSQFQCNLYLVSADINCKMH